MTNTWLKLENAICAAVNMSHLLQAAVEDSNEGKEEAVAFAAYKVWDLCRETKELFVKLCEEIRAIQMKRKEVVELSPTSSTR